MTNDRAGIFDGSQDFDVTGFAPKKPEAKDKKIPIEAVRAVSEAADFPSREALPAAAPVPAPSAPAPRQSEPRRKKRRYRTGRNVQLNIKVKAETVDAFYALADRQGWVLGETLERAIEALKASLKTKGE